MRFRLDWFLPALRKQPKAAPASKPGLLRALAERVLPTATFSDRTTKARGYARRALRWIGLTWLSSPVRRVSQAICFVTFLVLFFYVCFPYTARPVVVEAGEHAAWPSHYADD